MIELLKAQSLLSAIEQGRACDKHLASVLLSVGIDVTVTDKAYSANLQNMVRILEHEHERPTIEECYSEIYGSSDSEVYSESSETEEDSEDE
eukprot:scaffold32821_cov58-Attheya_sp.AAC.7